MAALAYVLLPVSGLVAYVRGSTVRVRAHGLQAIVFGATWPAALYAAAAASPGVTQAVLVVGAALWVVLVVGSAAGRDPFVPGLRRVLWAAATSSPSAPDDHAPG